MSQNHKIAKALEELTTLVNSGLNHGEFSLGHSDLLLRANHSILYLVNLFLCEKCQGSGDILNTHYIERGLKDPLQQCPDCQGTGIKAEILDRLEAEDITEEFHRETNNLVLQGRGDGNKQG